MWMLEKPLNVAFACPDDLPHEYVLGISKPYLGKSISTASRLDAAEALTRIFSGGYNQPQLDTSDPLAVQEFLDNRWRLSRREGKHGSEDIITRLAKSHGTPLFVVDHKVLRDNYAQFLEVSPAWVQAYYAVKANNDLGHRQNVLRGRGQLRCRYGVAGVSNSTLN